MGPDAAREIEQLAGRLAARVAARHAEMARPILTGLCGPQGSGKSTLAAAVARALGSQGLATAVLSLDDVYLTRAERAALARRVHPLLATRGPPGTHDVGLAQEVISALLEGLAVAVPRFDKARDDRGAPERLAAGVREVVLFEGWCVGARPQGSAALATTVNALERDEDADGRWRAFVDAALGGPYQRLFGRLDFLILLQAPDFETVTRWRQGAERELRAQRGGGMSAADVARFVQLYERLTRHIAAKAPARADVVVRLDAARRVMDVRGL